MKFTHALAPLTSIFLLPLCGTSPAVAAVYTVQVANYSFSPANVVVELSDTLRWVWIEGAHTTTSGDNCTPNGMWNRPLGPTARTYDFAFNAPGVFNYYCDPHCDMGMTGSVTVLDASHVAPTPSRPGLTRFQGVPNPFREGTEVKFQVSEACALRLAVFDAAGRQVALLAAGEINAGAHSIVWKGRTSAGIEMPGGIYYARIWTDRGTATATLVKIE